MGAPRHPRLGASTLLRRQARRQAGMTLVELLVVMVVLIVVLGAIYTIWFGLQRSYSFTNEDLTAQDQARQAMGEMVEFIRTARAPDPAPSEDLNVVIYSADKNTLVFWTDVDRDSSHDLELCRLRVDFSTGSLFRDTSQTGNPTFAGGTAVRLVTTGVTNNATDHPLFEYFRADGTQMTYPIDPTLIREIRIDLWIDIFVQNRPLAHELMSTVQPRNLRQY
jgi:prepilin-type N-terminal cleavage/methylation domain-containing protein